MLGARRPSALAGAVLGLALLAGCGSAGDVTTAAAPAAPSASPSAAASPVTTPATTTEAGPPPKCTTGDLAARLVPRSDELSAHRVAVTWTNTSERTCTMYGFGGVDLQGPDFRTLGPTFQLRRSSQDPRTVTLDPRESAETVVNYLTPEPDPSTPAAGPADAANWTPTTALVTPPDETRSVPLPWTFGPVLRQDGATRPGTFIHPVTATG